MLTYADLRSPYPDPDGREPSRDIQLHLTGHMERFAWSFDGIKFSDAEPLRLKYGERVRITLVNDTMMTHPIHLHGMWSDLEDEQGRFLVRKHTIDMPPAAAVATASAPTRWAAGPTTATCSTTWRPACSARYESMNEICNRRIVTGVALLALLASERALAAGMAPIVMAPCQWTMAR